MRDIKYLTKHNQIKALKSEFEKNNFEYHSIHNGYKLISYRKFLSKISKNKFVIFGHRGTFSVNGTVFKDDLK